MGNFLILAKRLKELRNNLNLTQVEFANKVGCTSTTLSAYENNLKKPSLDIIMDIAQNFNISIDWLCGLTDKMKSNDKVVNISDILKLLLEMENFISLDFELDEVDTQILDNGVSIKFNNDDIIKFLLEWKKMKELHDNKIIDDDVYNLWIEKTLEKNKAYSLSGGFLA